MATAELHTDLAGYDPTRDADGFWFDDSAATLAVEFSSRFCSHVKGKAAGEPYALNPWEEAVTWNLFGWKRPDGTRRYREAFIAIPRKNSKTSYCANLALYALLCDGEEGAEVYCAAGDRDQATLVFDVAAKMVAKNAKLSQLCTVKDSYKRIIFPSRNSFLRAIPADSAGSHGFNASCVIMDEVHTQPNRDLYDVLKTSMASRRQPLMVSITTAGHDKESICYELWDYAKQVRDGTITDPHFLPVIYEADSGDDWKDPEVWKRCNPNYGRSVSEEYLREAFERARKTPTFENTFRNLHLNQWTESDSRWISSESWDACQGKLPNLVGQPCFGGLDLASTDDLTALVYVFPLKGKYYVLPRFFVPEDTVSATEKKYQAQYRLWVNNGWLVRTLGSATDYEAVRQQIIKDAKTYRIREIGFDAWQALDTFQQLDRHGVEMTKIPQGFGGLWPGVKATEEAILSRALVHDGNECLRWQIASTVVDQDANGNRRPNKRKSQGEHGTKGKIDGVVALVMAMGLANTSTPGSVYNRRGVVTL